MEYKYYRELKHNYLVFEDKSAAKESRYGMAGATSSAARLSGDLMGCSVWFMASFPFSCVLWLI